MKKRKALNSVVQAKQSADIMGTLNELTDWLAGFGITPVPFDRQRVREQNQLNTVNTNCVLVFECIDPGLYVEDDMRFGICLLPKGIQIIMYPNDTASFGFVGPTTKSSALKKAILENYVDVIRRWSQSQQKEVSVSSVTKYRTIKGTVKNITDGITVNNSMLKAAKDTGLLRTIAKQTLRTEEIIIWS